MHYLYTVLFTFPMMLTRIESFWLVITSLILMTLMCDSGMTLLGEIRHTTNNRGKGKDLLS